jgi:uncharacterized membrane protein
MIWIFIIVDILIIGLGLIFKFAPPKNINHLYGYRTGRSMKNPVIWKAANTYWANLNLLASVLVVLFQLALLAIGKPAEGVLMATMIGWVAILITSIIMTERFLTQNFDKDGNLK